MVKGLTVVAIKHIEKGTRGAWKQHIGDEQHAVSEVVSEPLARRGRAGFRCSAITEEQHECHDNWTQRLKE